jgi:hypothetical protein
VVDPSRRQWEDAVPSFATQAELAVTKADVPADADAVTRGPPQPIAAAIEETRADRSVRPTEGAVEVTGVNDPTRPGMGTGATTGLSDPAAATDGFEVRPVIPGYEIEDELGRGGKGAVYKARNLRLNRAVALKMVLAGAYAGREAAFRFVTEAAARRLRRRYYEVLPEQIAATLDDPTEAAIDAEVLDLFAALGD